MATSAVMRIFQIFTGLGSVATTPFAVKFASKNINQISRSGRTTGESRVAEQEVIKPEDSNKDLKQGEVLQVVKQMMDDGKGDPSCFWLPNQKTGYELLMCVYLKQLESPVLFHYDSRNQLKEGKKVKRVEQITFTTGPTTMKFKNGNSVDIPRTSKLYLTTQFKKKNVIMLPENHCKIVGQKGDYKLTCFDSNKKETEIGKVDLETLHENKHKTLTR